MATPEFIPADQLIVEANGHDGGIRANVCEERVLIEIVECHVDGEHEHEVLLGVDEARALRDWLNLVLP